MPGLKILWVDDDIPRMISLHEMMAYEGHDVTPASSAEEAIWIIEQRGGEFDVVLLDIMMPAGAAFAGQDTDGGRKTGLLLLARIRKTLPDTPVVVASVVREQAIRDEALRLGVKEWLQKPTLPSEVLATIDRVCSSSSGSSRETQP